MKTDFRKEWKQEMDCEMLNHFVLHKTGTLVPPEEVEEGMLIFDTKFSFGMKIGRLNEIVRKARWVWRGSKDKESTKEETTSSTAKPITVLILVMEFLDDSSLEAYLDHWDETAAYLSAPRMTEAYVRQHPMYRVQGKEGHLWMLNKGLYGGRPSGRGFQIFSHGLLVSKAFGFVASEADACLFVKTSTDGKATMRIATIVDDYAVQGNHTGMRTEIFGLHQKYFVMKDLGTITVMTGVRFDINKTTGHAYIHQRAFNECWLRKFGFDKMKPANTPYVSQTFRKLSKNHAATSEEDVAYMKDKIPLIKPILGCMQWTRWRCQR
jgi:hypothetical protein